MAVKICLAVRLPGLSNWVGLEADKVTIFLDQLIHPFGDPCLTLSRTDAATGRPSRPRSGQNGTAERGS
jgi:hypothetical protein